MRRNRFSINGGPYVGFMLVIFSPELDFINSLSMNIPVGSVIFLPFGAVRFIDRSDIVEVRAVAVKAFLRKTDTRS